MFKRISKFIFSAVIFLVMALFLGALPLPTIQDGGRDEAKIVRIYVLSNGFHSDIAIPRENGLSLAGLGVNEKDFEVQLPEVKYWAVGWGSLTAYTSLMAVSDLTIGIAAKALAFDDAVMHITPLGQLYRTENIFAVDLSAEQYTALLSSLRVWFASTNPMEVTQGIGDRFYEAMGHFAPWSTCNSWSGRRLREAGVNVGLWTPLAQSLEFGLERVASNP